MQHEPVHERVEALCLQVGVPAWAEHVRYQPLDQRPQVVVHPGVELVQGRLGDRLADKRQPDLMLHPRLRAEWHQLLQHPFQHVSRVAGGVQGGEPGAHSPFHFAQREGEQLGLGREVMPQRAHGQAGLIGDHAHRHAIDAVTRDHPEDSVHQLGAAGGVDIGVRGTGHAFIHSTVVLFLENDLRDRRL
jgi:hypothetical protein